jgi:hypothetical protein
MSLLSGKVRAFPIGSMVRSSLLCFMLQLIFVLPSVAVTIDSGDGSGNTSAPANDPGWSYVGVRNSLSAVYLGNRWVLTARHVGVGSVILSGVTYAAAQPATSYPIQNPDDSSYADLHLFRLQDLPALAPLSLTSSAVTSNGQGTSVVMIGNGRDRPVDKTYWDASWVETSAAGAVYTGYKTVSTHTLRWGTNRVSDRNLVVDSSCYPSDPSNPGCRPTHSFALAFDSGSPTAHEARANSGDSGGAVFKETSGELAGIMFAINSYTGQPSSTYTIYGTSTFVVDLWYYRDEIQAVIDAHPDTDDDGILDADDNCLDDPNQDQLDSDGDGAGDVCDICPEDPFDDADADGLCGDIDTCPDIPNAGNNADTNDDGIGDYCQCGDVNGDGNVNNVDSILIKRAGLGLSVGGSFRTVCGPIGPMP